MSNHEDFLKRLMEAFLLEAEEHVQNISVGLASLCAGPIESFGDVVEVIYRNVHTLKGASRAVNFLGLEAVCQALESGLSSWRRVHGVVELSPEQTHLIEEVSQELHLALARGTQYSANPQWLKKVESPGGVVLQPAAAAIPAPVRVEPTKVAVKDDDSVEVPAVLHMPETIRVHTSRLETMAFLADELTQLRQDLKLASRFVEECQTVWRELQEGIRTSQNSEAIMRLNEFLRSARSTILHSDDRMRRSAEEIASTAHELLRMPASTLLDQLAYMARRLAVSLGKHVDVQVLGGDMQMDKRILEELKDALIHLVRNAVDHGLENPAEREAKNKPVSGLLRMSVEEEGYGRLRITIRDDGKGIDPDEMRRTVAKSPGHVTSPMTDEEAVDAIFLPDMSTRAEVTSVSGRGMGMSIVRQKVLQLGGEITVQSRVGVGTDLILILPANLASFRGLTVEIREHRFIIPVRSVLQSLRVRRADLKLIDERETLLLDGEVVVAVRLSQLLNLKGDSRSSGEQVGLLLEHDNKRAIILVDSFSSDEELLPRPFGFPIMNSDWWNGAALTGTRLVPILNIASLFERLVSDSARSVSASPPKAHRAFNVLVAEDSITSRMLLKGILESGGYLVKTASDGLEAWEKLQQTHFDAVVSDIEMPRMDGFALTERIKGDARLQHLPVVLITAMSKTEDRERGLTLGASAYIIKSNFEESGLIDALERILI